MRTAMGASMGWAVLEDDDDDLRARDFCKLRAPAIDQLHALARIPFLEADKDRGVVSLLLLGPYIVEDLRVAMAEV
jgi:hypothetical protein